MGASFRGERVLFTPTQRKAGRHAGRKAQRSGQICRPERGSLALLNHNRIPSLSSITIASCPLLAAALECSKLAPDTFLVTVLEMLPSSNLMFCFSLYVSLFVLCIWRRLRRCICFRPPPPPSSTWGAWGCAPRRGCLTMRDVLASGPVVYRVKYGIPRPLSLCSPRTPISWYTLYGPQSFSMMENYLFLIVLFLSWKGKITLILYIYIYICYNYINLIQRHFIFIYIKKKKKLSVNKIKKKHLSKMLQKCFNIKFYSHRNCRGKFFSSPSFFFFLSKALGLLE